MTERKGKRTPSKAVTLVLWQRTSTTTKQCIELIDLKSKSMHVVEKEGKDIVQRNQFLKRVGSDTEMAARILLI